VTGASLPAVELLLSSVQLGFALVEPEVPLVEEASCTDTTDEDFDTYVTVSGRIGSG
jgi:hypothetical protein